MYEGFEYDEPYGGQLQYERDDDYNVWEEEQIFQDREWEE